MTIFGDVGLLCKLFDTAFGSAGLGPSRWKSGSGVRVLFRVLTEWAACFVSRVVHNSIYHSNQFC